MGVETRRRSQDGNGDGSGSGDEAGTGMGRGWRPVDEHRIGAGTEMGV